MPSPDFLDWFFLKIYNLLTQGVHIGGPGQGFKNTIIFLLSLIGIFFVGVIIYSVTRLKERHKLNNDKYHDAIHHAETAHQSEKDSQKWNEIIKHIKSDNSGDWRIAIIEADNMLDALTRHLGLVGNDLGERLKNASPNHFRNLDNAWTAHKVRNKIAHEGLSFNLSYREAKKTIELYESVFKEFEII